MKIGIIGANGKAGSFILKEAFSRGHEVTAIVRNAAKVSHEQVAILEKNVFDLKKEDLNQFDVVVNAFKAPNGQEQQHVEAGRVLINALQDAPETRLIVVGGAGSLYVDESQTMKKFESPGFPEAYYPTAKYMGENLEDLRNTSSVHWTYISPGGVFDPEGEKKVLTKKEKIKLS